MFGGQPWWDQILQSLRDCDIFVYALTDYSLNSPYCQAECNYARSLNRTILPVLASSPKVSLPPDLSNLQAVDYSDRNPSAALSLAYALFNLPKSAALPLIEPHPPSMPLPDPVGKPSLPSGVTGQVRHVASDERSATRRAKAKIINMNSQGYLVFFNSEKDAIRLPSRLPGLRADPLIVSEKDASNWKKLHTSAEKALASYKDFHEQLIRCIESFRNKRYDSYDKARQEAQRILTKLPDRINSDLKEVCLLSVDKNSLLGKIRSTLLELDSPTIQQAFGYHLSITGDDDTCRAFLDDLLAVSEVIQVGLLMGALTTADRMLEKYFVRLPGVTT